VLDGPMTGSAFRAYVEQFLEGKSVADRAGLTVTQLHPQLLAASQSGSPAEALNKEFELCTKGSARLLPAVPTFAASLGA